jgi:membrane protease subunit HflC
MRVLEAPYAETTTKGAVTIIVNTYVVWRISDPLQFFNAHGGGSFMEATKKLRSQINDTQNRVIGQHAFGEFVNSDPTKVRFQQIEQEMQAELQHNIATANYGIEIKTLGIKQFKVSESVSKDVFARMRAERDSETAKIIAQGASLATKIRTDAEAKRMELLAAAEARAKAIRGQAEADAAKYYSLLQENPELAIFLRNVEALKEILKKNSTYVVPTDIEPFTLLNKIPDIQGRK